MVKLTSGILQTEHLGTKLLKSNFTKIDKNSLFNVVMSIMHINKFITHLEFLIN